MLIAILVVLILLLLVVSSCASHLDRIQKMQVMILEAKLEELRIWNGAKSGK